MVYIVAEGWLIPMLPNAPSYRSYKLGKHKRKITYTKASPSKLRSCSKVSIAGIGDSESCKGCGCPPSEAVNLRISRCARRLWTVVREQVS